MKPTFLEILAVTSVLTCCVGCDRGDTQSLPRPESAAAGSLFVSGHQALMDSESSTIEDRAPQAVPVYSKDVAPLIDKYCLSCHDSAVAEGGVVLDAFLDGVPGTEHRSLLLRIADNLRSESMPPDGEPRPDPLAMATLYAWLDNALGPDGRETGGTTLRRLNRSEYNHTIRDLIGLDLHPADEFPADDIGYGFDNIGEVLATPPILVEMYLAAADSVIGAAFRAAEVRERILNPPADTVPLAFRRYKPPVRTPRGDKTLRLARAAADPELAKQQHIYDVLRAFADRAFRRPATHDELMRLFGIVVSAEKDGESLDSGIQMALRAVLSSPQFLFRFEPGQDRGSSATPLPDNDFGLAARLSYFLWSSMPDEELFRLAATGALRRGETLRAQAIRMLRDPKSRALAENFVSQWLQTRKLKEVAPDPLLFPDFDDSLRESMLEETELFCESIQNEDRSVLEFLVADYSFVNERLARHYNIPGVAGEGFQRVSLAGTPRGGVLTQASVLTATSNPTRTSPVKRGKWILENILGAPPSPPPSGVEALKEGQGQGPSGTFRHKLERHRSDPACSSCHRRMDPLGFSLENFDAIGGWRTHDGESAVDPSGRLPGGRKLQGPAELRAALLSRPAAFARCLSEKMLTYALGRGLERADRRDVDRIVARLAREGYRFSALVLAVVESDPFRNARKPGGRP
jgi:Protein of unknown function (DUF1592)/Protein of unknown function (DUF1588)/Protein of unknown function (DUF1585)/Protein of unknown function (DUF1587)/Protein of unknown function (DUF1595)/Planctomycete cytochrome C